MIEELMELHPFWALGLAVALVVGINVAGGVLELFTMRAMARRLDDHGRRLDAHYEILEAHSDLNDTTDKRLTLTRDNIDLLRQIAEAHEQRLDAQRPPTVEELTAKYHEMMDGEGPESQEDAESMVVEMISLRGRSFPVVQEPPVAFRASGVFAGDIRIMLWADLDEDEDRSDMEFLQELSDSGASVAIEVETKCGNIYQGTTTVHVDFEPTEGGHTATLKFSARGWEQE